jgi:TRAP-type C4-dicarboxylate transport system permease large subunit
MEWYEALDLLVGSIIPPSALAVLLATLAKIDVGAFAGVIPGLILATF